MAVDRSLGTPDRFGCRGSHHQRHAPAERRHHVTVDETNRCEIGDTVVIAESRPISKDKHWTVQDILRRGTGEPIEIAEVEA